MNELWLDYVLVPVLIMLARIVDVSLDTIRVIMVAKGYRNKAPFVGFFQVLIWIITITRIMAHLEIWTAYIGYATGFAIGTYVGMKIEEKLALGYELIRVITRTDAAPLIRDLMQEGHQVTYVDGEGRDGKVGILFIILKRSRSKDIVQRIKQFNPNAFYTIEDVRFVNSANPMMYQTNRQLRTRYRPR
ncbi:MAG: DUF2179 domain-containing protein [Bacteroidales bacterium]